MHFDASMKIKKRADVINYSDMTVHYKLCKKMVSFLISSRISNDSVICFLFIEPFFISIVVLVVVRKKITDEADSFQIAIINFQQFIPNFQLHNFN